MGRAAELARLRNAWREVCERGSRRLLLLAGEPGLGKTRLALEFARGARDDGATVLLGRCSEDPLAPYEPFAELLRQIGVAPARALAGGAASEIGRLLGEAHARRRRTPVPGTGCSPRSTTCSARSPSAAPWS